MRWKYLLLAAIALFGCSRSERLNQDPLRLAWERCSQPEWLRPDQIRDACTIVLESQGTSLWQIVGALEVRIALQPNDRPDLTLPDLDRAIELYPELAARCPQVKGLAPVSNEACRAKKAGYAPDIL